VSPREFDPEVAQRRLRMLEELLDDLASIGDVDRARLVEDRLLRHAVERILTQLVELAVSVNSHVAATYVGQAPADYRSSFDLAVSAGLIDGDLSKRLQRSVGLRNILTHEYVTADLAVVARSVTEAREDYAAYVRAVAGWLLSRPENSPPD
jgi:uncharacterized protein YutE (UPF0331/DUF86 family)